MNTLKYKSVLLAGATGYLGSYILKELDKEGIQTTVIARNIKKIDTTYTTPITIKKAEVTKPTTLIDVCKGIDVVISTVGITRQKEGLTYMDVDYKANMNLLQEALKSGVQHFIYVSAIKGDTHKHLKILTAKEKFVDELKKSGLKYTIVRPNGFFSDMKDFLQMAASGKVYLFGDGNQKLNPIHGADLAVFMVNLIGKKQQEIAVGGPDILSLNEISKMALSAVNKPLKIFHFPDGIRKGLIWCLRTFTNVRFYGPLEFFLTLMATDTVAKQTGVYHLKDFYLKEALKLQKES